MKSIVVSAFLACFAFGLIKASPEECDKQQILDLTNEVASLYKHQAEEVMAVRLDIDQGLATCAKGDHSKYLTCAETVLKTNLAVINQLTEQYTEKMNADMYQLRQLIDQCAH